MSWCTYQSLYLYPLLWSLLKRRHEVFIFSKPAKLTQDFSSNGGASFFLEGRKSQEKLLQNDNIKKKN